MASGPAFSWAHLGLVAAGGAIGTALRAAALLWLPDTMPGLVVAGINVAGAFLLGLVTGAIVTRADTARLRAARQFLGTGLLGGFTTYSTFALDAVSGTALWLTVATAVLGVGAAAVGLLLGRRRPAVDAGRDA